MTTGSPRQINHWCRVMMNRATTEHVNRLNPASLDVLEISGSAWQPVGFRSYLSVAYPEFDICRHRLAATFDLVIAEQVFEHIADPAAAAINVLNMVRPGGTFLVTTPFLIKINPSPLDLWRWTESGLKLLLERVGFSEVATYSWGNRACVIGNFEQWPMYDPMMHSLENDPEFPIVVWGFAKRA